MQRCAFIKEHEEISIISCEYFKHKRSPKQLIFLSNVISSQSHQAWLLSHHYLITWDIRYLSFLGGKVTDYLFVVFISWQYLHPPQSSRAMIGCLSLHWNQGSVANSCQCLPFVFCLVGAVQRLYLTKCISSAYYLEASYTPLIFLSITTDQEQDACWANLCSIPWFKMYCCKKEREKVNSLSKFPCLLPEQVFIAFS